MHAELSLDAGLGNAEDDSIKGVLDDVDIDGFDHLRDQAMLRPELKHSVDDLMGEATARIGLDSQAVAQECKGPAKLFDRLLANRRALMEYLVKTKS